MELELRNADFLLQESSLSDEVEEVEGNNKDDEDQRMKMFVDLRIVVCLQSVIHYLVLYFRYFHFRDC